MEWFLGYLIGMTATIVLLTRFDPGFKPVLTSEVNGLKFVLFIIVWPLTLFGYTLRLLVEIPTSIQNYRWNSLEYKRQNELAAKRHETALAIERALKAEALNREAAAFGLPSPQID